MLVLAAPAAAETPGGALALQPGETLLEVEATGDATGTPDEAGLSVEIATDGATPAAALAANNELAAKLADAARDAGVPDKAMRTTDLSVTRKFRLDKDGDPTDQMIGYTATSSFEMRHLTIPAASAAISALAGAGITGLSGPDFGFADEESLRRQSRAAAVARARAQADDYAAALGMKIVRVLRVSERYSGGGEGQDIIVTARRRSVPPPVLLPGEQKITTRIWIDFAMAPR